MRGAAAVGSTVTPVGASWSGGWGNETSALAVIACSSHQRTDCEPVSGPLAPKYGGWYLYGVDTRLPGDPDPAAPVSFVAYSPPVGPVAVGKTDPDPNAQSHVKLLARAQRYGSQLTVARVVCPDRCAVELRVSDGHRTLRRKLTTSARCRSRSRTRAVCAPASSRSRCWSTVAGQPAERSGAAEGQRRGRARYCWPARTVTVLRLTLSRTLTTPSVTLVSVPAHVSWTSHLVPRIVAALYLPVVRKLPLPLPQSLRVLGFLADARALLPQGASGSTSVSVVIPPDWLTLKIPP